MKTAYELAMERLNKTAPSVKLSREQKSAIADLESRYKARIAEREIASQEELTRLREAGDAEKIEEAQRRLASERQNLFAELEEKKEQVRNSKS